MGSAAIFYFIWNLKCLRSFFMSVSVTILPSVCSKSSISTPQIKSPSAVLPHLYGRVLLPFTVTKLRREGGDKFFWSSLNLSPWVPESQGLEFSALVAVLGKRRHSCPSSFGRCFFSTLPSGSRQPLSGPQDSMVFCSSPNDKWLLFCPSCCNS